MMIKSNLSKMHVLIIDVSAIMKFLISDQTMQMVAEAVGKAAFSWYL
jgi:hypothetical protein